MAAALHDWGEYLGAFALFFAAHALPARPPIRRGLVAALGEPLYLAVYAGLSVVILAWLIAAAGRAPVVVVWESQPWQRWVPNLAMPVGCLLAAFGVGAPNPLSFGGWQPQRFVPAKPGIAGFVRHPLLWAMALWAGAHAVANGDLAHVLLFGSFALFALAGMAAIDRRMKRRLGEREWRRLAHATSLMPFGSVASGRLRSWPIAGGGWRLLGAFLLYAALLLGHEAAIGVSPLPVP